MTETPPRHGLAAEIAEVIGEAQTARLLSARGGTQIVIPVHAGGSQLAELIGVRDAARMIRHFGHGRLTLPVSRDRGMGQVRQRGLRMLAEGASLREVALACGVTERAVSKWRQMLGADDPRQPRLFD